MLTIAIAKNRIIIKEINWVLNDNLIDNPFNEIIKLL